MRFRTRHDSAAIVVRIHEEITFAFEARNRTFQWRKLFRGGWEKGIHYSACESLKRSPSIGVDRVNFRKGGSEVISRYVRSRIEDVVGRRWG